MPEIAVSILPVFIFLLLLIYFDSYKLVKINTVILLIGTGCLSALLSYFINVTLLNNVSINHQVYVRYIAPVIEESLKAVAVVYMIKGNKTGFLVDAVIYGFAVGAGFAFIENIYYLNTLESPGIFLWIIRGFGTAVMHGGTTAIFAIISKNLYDRADDLKIIKSFQGESRSKNHFSLLLLFLPGLFSAIIIHSFFNHLILPAIIITVLQLFILPLLMIFIFRKSENTLRDWMEKGLDDEVLLLEQIDNGIFSETHAGRYLHSLSNRFAGPVLVDMLCMIKLHVELSIKAKGVILLRKAGLNVIIEDDIKEKFEELKYLEKNIGPTGKLAVSPVFNQSTQDLWQLYMLGMK